MENAGVVGLGWTLMANANISRTVHGIPDEVNTRMMMGIFHLDEKSKKLREYVKTKPKEYNYFNTTIPYAREVSKYCQAYEEGRADMANDVLTIAGMGLSGTFIYDDNRRMVLQTSSNIVCESGSMIATAYPGSYHFKDAKGTQYTFGEREESKYKYVHYYDRDKDPIEKTSTINYISAWHLTRMESLQGDVVTFEYVDLGNRRNIIGAYSSYEMCFNSTWISNTLPGFQANETEIDYYPKLLKRIITKAEIIEFDYETFLPENSYYLDKYDRLKRIVVKQNNNQQAVTRQFEFTYKKGPFWKDKGFQVSKIEEIAPAGNKELVCEFEYNEESVIQNFRKAQDHWGYYNGIDNKSLLPEMKAHPLAHYLSGDRSINKSATQTGILERIIYPTGGSTTFQWEQHDYSYINSRDLTGTVNYETEHHEQQLWGLEKKSVLTRFLTLHEKTDIKIDVSTYVQPLEGKGYLSPEADDGWRNYHYNHENEPHLFMDYPQVVIYNDKNEAVERIFIDIWNSQSTPIRTLFPGSYTIKLENPREIECADLKNELERSLGDEGFGYVTISYDEKKIIPNPNYYWGGLRIAKITSFTSDDTNASVSKSYIYKTTYDNIATKSSGVVPFEPYYEYNYGMGGHLDSGGIGDNFDDVYGISSCGFPKVIGGSAGIEYFKVFEIIETNNGNTVTEYNFSTYKDFPEILDMGFSDRGPRSSQIYTSNAIQRGDLLSVRYFNPEDAIYDKTHEYHYSLITETPSEFTGDFVKICDYQNLQFQDKEPLIADYTVSTYTLTPYIKLPTQQVLNETSPYGLSLTQSEGYTYFTDEYSPSCHSRFVRSHYSFDSQDRKRETFYTYFQGNYEYPETEVTVTDGTIISSRLNVYDNKGRLTETFRGPSGIPVSSDYNLGGKYAFEANSALKAMINIPEYSYTYNSDGNIVQISYNGIVLASYLWGYKGKHPIVEALNVDYATLSAKTSASGYNPQMLNECSDESVLSAFFPALRQAMVGCDLTTMTYHWLVGVSSMTDSSGITTNFSFDDFGRLKDIKDYNGYFIRKFEYNYRKK